MLKKALSEKSKEASIFYERQSELEDSLVIFQDKFERLHHSHRKIQSINQTLEEKLLKLVDRNTGEKAQLIGDCATLNIRLNQANLNILQLQREIVSIFFCAFIPEEEEEEKKQVKIYCK